MIADVKYEMKGLNYFVTGLMEALAGNGATEGDMVRLVRTEAGQLAYDMSEQIGPKSKGGAAKAIEWDMKKHLTTAPDYVSEQFNGGRPQESETYADFTWLTAGRGKNGKFLLGINNEDIQTSASADEVKRMLRVAQRGQDRGDAYIKLGTRGAAKSAGGTGRVNVLRLNRIKVSKSAFAEVKRYLQSKIGEARASFAYTAAQLLPNKRIPAWVRDKFPNVVANGKTIYNDSGLNDLLAPVIAFGSRAKGVESNPDMVEKLRRTIKYRTEIIIGKLEKVVRGYTYDYNTGKVFKRRVPENGVPE